MMAVSIKNCPNCGTMLFSDTVQCPACRHVLDARRHREWEARAQNRLPSAGTENACPQCGEMVREGLVRCWNCNSFMRSEIAEEYRKMQSAAQPVIYSPLSHETDDADRNPSTEAAGEPADEDEFELGAGIPLAMSLPQDAITPAGKGDAHAGNGTARGDQPADPDVPHSVATGGDVLYQTALAEEVELKNRRKQRRDDTLMVYCPNGHRIEVREKYRGRMGRCPKCKSPFFVPELEKEAESESAAPQAAAAPAAAYGKYSHWMADVSIHVVNPEKLKLKAGSLKADFQFFDLVFSPDDMLGLALSKKKGPANLTAAKRLQDREALQEAIRSGKPAAESPAAEHFSLTAEQVKKAAVVQPAAYAHESMFAGIPVFGEWRIAVRFVLGDGAADARFACFGLSGFRQLAKILSELYGIEDLTIGLDIPMDDSFAEAKCHYSEQMVRFLKNVDYYANDPDFKLKLVGRKCQACGLVVSEDSRKKEKIGGANGKAIAKAKCPKCQQKFGSISLFTLETPEPEPAAATPQEKPDDAPKEEPAAAKE